MTSMSPAKETATLNTFVADEALTIELTPLMDLFVIVQPYCDGRNRIFAGPKPARSLFSVRLPDVGWNTTVEPFGGTLPRFQLWTSPKRLPSPPPVQTNDVSAPMYRSTPLTLPTVPRPGCKPALLFCWVTTS